MGAQDAYLRCRTTLQTRNVLPDQLQILFVEVFLFTSPFLFPFPPVALALFDLFIVIIDEAFLDLVIRKTC